MSLTVLAAGVGTSVQDLGRPGYAALGVPRSGAADRRGLSLANRLLGNPPGCAAIEAPLGGLSLRSERAVWMATAGAIAEVRVDGRPVGTHVAFYVRAGGTITIDRPSRGLRSYLAVRGGLAVEPLLGSASEDVLSGITPARVRPGLILPVGRQVDDDLPGSGQAPPLWRGEAALELTPGPRADWLTREALRLLTASTWAIGADSNRIGVRLSGPRLDRARRGELPSEPLVPGSVQVPPSGQPVLFLADHPTTGGYPVVAVVREESLSVLGQLAPGEIVRLTMRR